MQVYDVVRLCTARNGNNALRPSLHTILPASILNAKHTSTIEPAHRVKAKGVLRENLVAQTVLNHQQSLLI